MFRRGSRVRKSNTIAVSSRYYCMAGFIVLRSSGASTTKEDEEADGYRA